MVNINKRQASIAVLAVVLATAMIVGVIATSDSAFAHKWHKNKHNHSANHHNDGKSNHQSISQNNQASQRSTIVTAGANSPVQNSGNQQVTQSNTNNGGNAAAF